MAHATTVGLGLAEPGRLNDHHPGLDDPRVFAIGPEDSFKGGSGDDSYVGGAGDDVLVGRDGNDTLKGMDGNDTIEGGAGDDVLNGGAGFNTLSYAHAQGGVTVNLLDPDAQDTGGAGIDQIKGFSGLVGSAYGDHLSVASEASSSYAYYTLDGGAGNDTIDAGMFGSILLSGGVGDDVISLSRTGASETPQSYEVYTVYTLDGGAGDDTVDAGSTGGTLVIGGLGDDLIRSSSSSNRLTYAGNKAGVQVDLSRTDAQDTGGAGIDRISGFDQLIGSSFADTLTGTNGDDVILGGKGSDMLNGGGGDDRLHSGKGVDTLSGGPGDDLYLLGNSNDVIVEAANGGYDRVFVTGSYTLSANIEFMKLFGGHASSELTGVGNDEANLIQSSFVDTVHLMGMGGDDKLSGHGNAVTLDGGDGNDTLIASGSATLIGGAGDDRYEVGYRGASTIIEAADGGVDRVISGSTYTLPDNVEDLDITQNGQPTVTATGNQLDNVIKAHESRDTLDGEGGNDTLSGGGHATASYVDAPSAVTVDLALKGAQDTGAAGHDTLIAIPGLIGSAFDDALSGDKSADTLSGGDGADTLNGRHGADVLTGGAGANVFVYESVMDSTASAADRITDLTSADQIDLSKIDADTTLKGNQAFTLVSAFDHHAGELTVNYDASTGKTTISGDVNGDGVADLVITADGDHHDFTGFVL